MRQSNDVVAKVWKLCDVLRDDGITYHQYVNELTYLLFLKMAQEVGVEHLLPKECRWSELTSRQQNNGEQYHRYLKILNDLATRARGRVREIFAHSASAIRHAESLEKLIDAIDSINWHAIGRERFGEIYEGILQKNASEKKSGAGQYFTPRPLIDAIVTVTRPRESETVLDPAAGTAGFFVAAQLYSARTTRRKSHRKLKCHGIELVRDTQRLALMNMALHEIDGDVVLGDALTDESLKLPKADLILTNPPFGSKKGAGRRLRATVEIATSNKQLAFLQLAVKTLKPSGRAAIVVPDNVLFEEGVASKIRQQLIDECDLHTLLRLPTGIFYAEGVKTNVLFFNKSRKRRTQHGKLWIYDMRHQAPSFGRRTPLTSSVFCDFINAYGVDPYGGAERTDQGVNGRFRSFSYDLIRRDRKYNMDISWLKHQDPPVAVPQSDPMDVITEVLALLRRASDEISAVSELLQSREADRG